jgi:hypothetical protein
VCVYISGAIRFIHEDSHASQHSGISDFCYLLATLLLAVPNPPLEREKDRKENVR